MQKNWQKKSYALCLREHLAKIKANTKKFEKILKEEEFSMFINMLSDAYFNGWCDRGDR